MMSLNVFSNSVKKGMLQGLQLWRAAVHKQRITSMDYRCDQIVSGLEMLTDQKANLRYKIGVMR